MKQYALAVLVVVGMGLAAVEPAAQAPVGGTARPTASPSLTATRVGVIDLAAVERSLPVTGQEVDEYSKRRITQLDSDRSEIQALKRRIVEGGDKLGADAREELLKDINRRQEALRVAEQSAQQDVQAKVEGGKLVIRDHIAKVASEQGIQLVLERTDAAILWSASSIDLTAAVVESVRKALRR